MTHTWLCTLCSLCTLCLLCTLCSLCTLCAGDMDVQDLYTNQWAVHIPGGLLQADTVATKYGYRNLGQIGGLEDHYHFQHSRVFPRSVSSAKAGPSLTSDPRVLWVQQQVIRPRVKRFSHHQSNSGPFNDPEWSNMWYIHCSEHSKPCHSQMNIASAWRRGFTGRKVVVSILDDGIETTHPDLSQNYDHLASFDVNENDHDPTPHYDTGLQNVHGTRCAGEVAAAANNSHCIVGVAYNAHIGGIRMLDGDVTDLVEATSLGIRPDYIHIYSASWGPRDDGKTVDGPGPLTLKAFEQGILKGRGGLGSIYVWASGNGGEQSDHCSCDGYTNSIYTISVSSTTQTGNTPWYHEACSAIITTTYSSGHPPDGKIVTTDTWQRCTDAHTGTSVSAPIVAGVVALVLEANFLLTWRDVQHLLVQTSRPLHLKANDWRSNAAGHRVSHLYGFGLLDADAMVVEASRWTNVPPQHTCVHTPQQCNSSIAAGHRLSCTVSSSGCSLQPEQDVQYLEHVVSRVLIVHPRRGDLQINLVSPSGTTSQLLSTRRLDRSPRGFKDWDFMTVHFWGEKAHGTWTLEVVDSPSGRRNPAIQGCLKEWTLILYGTSESPQLPTGTVSPLETLGHPLPQGSVNPGGDTCVDAVRHKGARTECGDGFRRAGLTCVPECSDGTFLHLEEMKCLPCHVSCRSCTGRGQDSCLHCAQGYLQQDGRCVSSCSPSFFPADVHGLPHRMCQRCEGHCLSCEGPGPTCTECADGLSLVRGRCIRRSSCRDAEQVFCETMRTNRLCGKTYYRLFCCQTCLLNG